MRLSRGRWIAGALLVVLAGCSEARSMGMATDVALTSVVAEEETPSQLTPELAATQHPTFETYWYQGLAELNRYRLDQVRYGDVHEGEAVLIFVTEDFLADRQVKYEHGDRSNAVGVLKLNAYRRFYTGIYPYTIQTSVFSPVSEPDAPALKVSITAQEWCGSVYSQLNLRGDVYEGQLHSYFQDESDRQFIVPSVTLEDELWTRIRRDPTDLPVGRVSIIPAMHHFRFVHRPVEAMEAQASLERVYRTPYSDEPALVYRLTYNEIPRSLHIYFRESFPYQIVAWEEVHHVPSEQAGSSSVELTTRGVLTHSVLLDYWNHNSVRDAGLRDRLGLAW